MAVGRHGATLKEAEDSVDDDGIYDAFKDGTQHVFFSLVICFENITGE